MPRKKKTEKEPVETQVLESEQPIEETTVDQGSEKEVFEDILAEVDQETKASEERDSEIEEDPRRSVEKILGRRLSDVVVSEIRAELKVADAFGIDRIKLFIEAEKLGLI